MQRLNDKIALVTGAARGIGRGIAERFAAEGARVVVTDIREEEGAALAFSLGDRATWRRLDVREETQWEAVAGWLRATWGRLDILVNNAGLIRRADAVDFSEKDWDDVMNVNIKSAFFMSQAAGRHFIAQGSGKIINIASMLSFQGGIRVPSYTASKSGIAGITRLLANEWGAKGVNINAIAPGYMATDNTAQLRADEDRNKAILDRIPAGRWGEPSDLGGTAVFLASRASDYVNGAVIPVDGGWLAR